MLDWLFNRRSRERTATFSPPVDPAPPSTALDIPEDELAEWERAHLSGAEIEVDSDEDAEEEDDEEGEIGDDDEEPQQRQRRQGGLAKLDPDDEDKAQYATPNDPHTDHWEAMLFKDMENLARTTETPRENIMDAVRIKVLMESYNPKRPPGSLLGIYQRALDERMISADREGRREAVAMEQAKQKRLAEDSEGEVTS